MNERAKWLTGTGPDGDIVVSTRVRLARNLSDVPFPGTMTEQQAADVVARVMRVIELGSSHGDVRLDVVRMADLTSLERLVMVEEHLISPGLANSRQAAVALSPDKSSALMINEEDHLRIQCILPGLSMGRAGEIANRYDDLMEKELPFAFHAEYGYLTACPTNAGTGMRASVMLHLPGLVTSGNIGRVLSAIGQFGLMARGLYGEGTQAAGNLFQISNQVTSGLTEDEIIKNLISVVNQIVSQERAILASMLRRTRTRVEDRVHRALGVLQAARLLNGQEAMSLLSDVRMGVAAGVIEGLDGATLNALLVSLQPGSLQHTVGRELGPHERDAVRAENVRLTLRRTMNKEENEK